MRVAVAGSGAFARHFVDQLPLAGHDVVLLTRSHKPAFDAKPGLLEQRVTDFASAEQLASLLLDCEALVVAVSDYTEGLVRVHETLVRACQQTPKCKRFIPAEFYANSERHPEAPGSLYQHNVAMRELLRKQSELEWTVVALGWIADYLVPAANRYHVDLGPVFPLDLNTKTLTIPGTGDEKFAITSARGVATAVAELLKSETKWRPYTFVQGEETTWNTLKETLTSAYELAVVYESVEEIQATLDRAKEDEDQWAVAQFQLYGPLGKLELDQDRVKQDRAEFFPSVHFRSTQEILEAVKNDPSTVV